jgi:hypothetical protein
MASADLSRRVGKAVAYSPLCEMSDLQRREFHEALLDADTFEDLAGKWQAAILKAEETGPSCGPSAAIRQRASSEATRSFRRYPRPPADDTPRCALPGRRSWFSTNSALMR